MPCPYKSIFRNVIEPAILNRTVLALLQEKQIQGEDFSQAKFKMLRTDRTFRKS